jgi:hypothetical protein
MKGKITPSQATKRAATILGAADLADRKITSTIRQGRVVTRIPVGPYDAPRVRSVLLRALPLSARFREEADVYVVTQTA